VPVALRGPFIAGGHDVVSEEAEPTKRCNVRFFRRGKNGENEIARSSNQKVATRSSLEL